MTRIKAALEVPACERLKDFYNAGPAQRAAVESFADSLGIPAPHAENERLLLEDAGHVQGDLIPSDAADASRASERTPAGSEQHAHGALPPLKRYEMGWNGPSGSFALFEHADGHLVKYEDVAEAEQTIAQLMRALREAIEPPTFMGEPISTQAGVPPSHEWLRLHSPEKWADWKASNAAPSVVDWMAGWDACRRVIAGNGRPFPKGSWQHAIDDQLVEYGKTSEHFATPHEAVAYLVEVLAASCSQVAVPEGMALVPIELIGDMLRALQRIAAAGSSSMAQAYTDIAEAAIAKATAAALPGSAGVQPNDALDAKRYRWLRAGRYDLAFARFVLNDTPHGIDSAIDAEMAKGQE